MVIVCAPNKAPLSGAIKMGVPFALIRDTPTDSYRKKGTHPTAEEPKPPHHHHGVADDASRSRLAVAAAAAAPAAGAAARDARPRHGRRRARPLGARERAADAQPVRDRVGAAGHQLHRHEARLRRGLGRRHRQDRESLSLSLLPFLVAPVAHLRVVASRSWHPFFRSESVGIAVHLSTICGAVAEKFSVKLLRSRKELTPLPSGRMIPIWGGTYSWDQF